MQPKETLPLLLLLRINLDHMDITIVCYAKMPELNLYNNFKILEIFTLAKTIGKTNKHKNTVLISSIF
jgi:hypothetical protein